MQPKKLIILIVSLAGAFILYVTTLICFRGVIKEYGAVVTSISTFLYLLFNCIVVGMNIINMNYSQMPIVIISFETLKPELGCFTFKNIGSTAAIIKSITIDPKWLEQFFAHNNTDITESEKKFLRELKKTHIVLPPREKIVIKPLISPQAIIDAQYSNAVALTVEYLNINNKRFTKRVVFDFTQYNEMISYMTDDDKPIGVAMGQ